MNLEALKTYKLDVSALPADFVSVRLTQQTTLLSLANSLMLFYVALVSRVVQWLPNNPVDSVPSGRGKILWMRGS